MQAEKINYRSAYDKIRHIGKDIAKRVGYTWQ